MVARRASSAAVASQLEHGAMIVQRVLGAVGDQKQAAAEDAGHVVHL